MKKIKKCEWTGKNETRFLIAFQRRSCFSTPWGFFDWNRHNITTTKQNSWVKVVSDVNPVHRGKDKEWFSEFAKL